MSEQDRNGKEISPQAVFLSGVNSSPMSPLFTHTQHNGAKPLRYFFGLCLGLLSPLLAITPLTTLKADEVYRWEDSEGVVHYSSKPQEADAKPADLPRITRGRLGLQAKAADTCQNHGDINCQAGADVDGSVICTDGYLDATTRYRFYCNSPKLEVADIGELQKNGDLKILVRNAKSVAAEKPELILRLNQIAAGVILKGPERIEPFEVGEFTYRSSEYGAISQPLERSQVTVTCMNCDN